MADHRKLSNSEFKNLLDAIETKADGDAAGYGLTQGLIDDIKANRDVLAADIADQRAKQDAATAATTKLRATRAAGNRLAARVKQTMKLGEVAENRIVDLGFNADDAVATPIGAQTPTELSVEGFSNGSNKMKFKRSGNKPNTIFTIEAKTGGAASFVIVGTTTTTTFNHTNQTPGVKVVYRVRAQRGNGGFSEYSNEAIVYN